MADPEPQRLHIVPQLSDCRWLTEIHQQAGSVTIMWYDIGVVVPDGEIRTLDLVGQSTTTIDQVTLALTAPSNLAPAKAYEQAIIAEL
jgi:hypothetical protein